MLLYLSFLSLSIILATEGCWLLVKFQDMLGCAIGICTTALRILLVKFWFNYSFSSSAHCRMVFDYSMVFHLHFHSAWIPGLLDVLWSKPCISSIMCFFVMKGLIHMLKFMTVCRKEGWKGISRWNEG